MRITDIWAGFGVGERERLRDADVVAGDSHVSTENI